MIALLWKHDILLLSGFCVSPFCLVCFASSDWHITMSLVSWVRQQRDDFDDLGHCANALGNNLDVVNYVRWPLMALLRLFWSKFILLALLRPDLLLVRKEYKVLSLVWLMRSSEQHIYWWTLMSYNFSIEINEKKNLLKYVSLLYTVVNIRNGDLLQKLP